MVGNHSYVQINTVTTKIRGHFHPGTSFLFRRVHDMVHTPSLEYSFVLVSLSTTLNLSICCMKKQLIQCVHY